MTPSTSSKNISNSSDTYTEAVGKYFSLNFRFRVSLKNQDNLLGGKFGIMTALTFLSATFIVSVLNIFGLGTQEHMVVVNTGGVIAIWAVMANTLIFWYRTVFQFPGKSVGANSFTLKFESAVTKSVFTGGPNPTAIRFSSFIDFFPKAFFGGVGIALAPAVRNAATYVAGVTAKLIIAPGNTGGGHEKFFATVLANSRIFWSGNGIIGAHRNLSFLCHASGDANHAGALCCLNPSNIISHFSLLG